MSKAIAVSEFMVKKLCLTGAAAVQHTAARRQAGVTTAQAVVPNNRDEGLVYELYWPF